MKTINCWCRSRGWERMVQNLQFSSRPFHTQRKRRHLANHTIVTKRNCHKYMWWLIQ